jgi:general transcription factor 3C polypeptide 3 (transcription factor C subunit 4)
MESKMENSENPIEYIGEIIDISSTEPKTVMQGESQEPDLNDVEFESYEIVDNSMLDPLYFSNTEDEQALVSRLLDEDFHFNENNIAESVLEAASSSQKGNVSPVDNAEDNEEVEKFESEDKPESESNLPKNEGPRPRRIVRKLPPALKGLMGEANLRCARGDRETAVKICLEIIRQVPTTPEPFLTLAGIYDEMGDQEKFLQMSFVAAHLSPTDAYQWVHLADLSEEQGHIKQAITCYTRAINVDVQNMDLHKKRAILLEKIGDKRTAIRGYHRLLSALTPDKGEYIMSVAKFVAEMFHKENDLVKANSALEVAVEKCPNLINLEFINLHLELLIQLKDFKRCLEILVDFCDLVLEGETDENDTFIVLDCKIPFSTPLDILAKLSVILIHVKSSNLVPKIIGPITQVDPSAVGELYLDIIEAYMEEEEHSEACNLLNVLLTCDNYNLPAVWLKYADNLRILGNYDEAVSAYYKVLDQAPHHTEVRMTLANILTKLNREQEAIHILTQTDEECIDSGLLYERCVLLKKDKSQAKELIMVAQILFLRHSTNIRNKDELSAISKIQRYDRKRNTVKQVRKCRKELEYDYDVPKFKTGAKEPSPEDEWELFKYVCSLCVQLKMYTIFERLTFTAQLSTVFNIFKFEIDLLSAISAFYNGDSHNGYNIIRTLVVKHPTNVKLWHIFNLIVTKSDDARHNRFIMRQLTHNSSHPALGLLHGNNCLVSGTYKYAMHEYSTAFMKKPTALCALLLGLTYLQMAAQKFTSKKHHLVIQALGLLAQYKAKRGPDGLQEAHYNLGRGFHHLGLYTPAIFHYKQVLAFNTNDLAKEKPHIFDLSREAAYNLHLIYCHSESYEVAKMYLEKYIII